MACGILVPRPGIEPVPPMVEAQSPNHWTDRKVPNIDFLKNFILPKITKYLPRAAYK